MKLRPGEKVLRTYYHHFLPFLYRIFYLVLSFLPIFVLMFLFAQAVSWKTAIIGYTIVFVLFALASLYLTFVYWLDRLVVTNHRVIFIDWKLLTAKSETESDLIDIQDIRSNSTGILSFFSFLDYGEFEIETASYNQTINFTEAPNPDGIKEFIHSLQVASHPHRSHTGINGGILAADAARTPDRRSESPVG